VRSVIKCVMSNIVRKREFQGDKGVGETEDIED